jgi:antitoxin HicB
MHYKLPLIFEPQPEGGYTVTSPAIPELLTEGDTVDDALENVRDAFAAVLEIYRDLGKPLPAELAVGAIEQPVRVDLVVTVP